MRFFKFIIRIRRKKKRFKKKEGLSDIYDNLKSQSMEIIKKYSE